MLSACHPRGEAIYDHLRFWAALTNSNRMSDNTLTTLMGHVPTRLVYVFPLNGLY